MAYTRQNLSDGDILHGSHLRAIEDELVTLDTAKDNMSTTESNHYAALQAADSNEATARATEDTALSGRITAEAATRAEEDTAIRASLSSAVSTLEGADTDLGDRITAEATARAAADANLQLAVDSYAETGRTLNSGLQTEIQARTDADTALGTRITTVQADLNTAIGAVASDLSAHIASAGTEQTDYERRTNARLANMETSIANNATAASDLVAAEQAARESADVDLQTSINAVDARVTTLAETEAEDMAEAAMRITEIRRLVSEAQSDVGAAVRYDTAQSLTSSQKTQARANIGAASQADLDAISLDPDDIKAVAFDKAQTLTETQQAQARGNIGAASQADLDDISVDPNDIGAVAFDKAQTLSAAQQTQARANIGLADISSMVSGTVRYDRAQSLTTVQQETARENILAAPASLSDTVATIARDVAELQAAIADTGDIVEDVIKTETGIRVLYAGGTTKDIAIDAGASGMPIDDWAYDEDHLLHLYDVDGNDLLEPLLIEGGGGGGGSTAGRVSITRVTPASTAFIYGDEALIQYRMTATDGDGDAAGDGTGSISVAGIVVASGFTVYQGQENSFDIGPYLQPGSNEVRLVVTVDVGADVPIRAAKTWTVSAVNMYFTWDYDQAQINTSAYLDRWTVYGADISKTTHTLLDGVALPTQVTTRSAYQQSVSIPMQEHGAHSIERWLTAVINGQTEPTAHQYKELIFAVEGNDTPIISISKQDTTCRMYDTVAIPVVVYDPTSETADAVLLVDGAEIGEWNEIDRTVHIWNYTPTAEGAHTLGIRCGSVTRTITVTATLVELNASEVEGWIYRFKASEMASNASVRNWESNGITASFNADFDWINGGLHTETVDGNLQQYLCIKAGDRMTIGHQLFGTDPRGAGVTWKMIFKAANCRDYDAVVATCKSGGVGIELRAHEATLSGSATETRVQYDEDDYVELEFDVYPLLEGGQSTVKTYLQGWMDGVLSTTVPYTQAEAFVQSPAASLVIGSDDCDVLVYMVKAYPRVLTADEHISNRIMDAPNASELVARYDRNNIINDATGEIDWQMLVTAAPDIRVWLWDIPYMTNGKKDKVKNCAFHQRWQHGTTYYQIDGVGTLTVQGTSSVNYIRGAANTDANFTALTDGSGNNLLANGVIDEDNYGKNYFYSEDGSTVKVYTPAEALAETQQTDEDATSPGCEFVAVSKDSGGAVTGYIKALGLKVSDTSCPISYSNTKVNFASCEQVNNLANAIWYERFEPVPSMTPRDCMEFGMGVEFIRDDGSADRLPDENHFVLFGDSRYHLYSIGNMGNSKKNVHVFHDLTNPNEVCIEVKDNTTPRQRMIDDNMGAAAWGDEFECRYPDTDNPSQAILSAWQRLLTWMASRNPNAYTGDALSRAETYPAYTFRGHSRTVPASDGLHNYAQVLRGTTVTQYAGTYTHDTFERRMARMLSECEDYLIMDSFVYHFLFLERHTCVDNVVKNTFWSSTDLQHWDVTKAYDMDTSDGNNNNGEMVFDYGNEHDATYVNPNNPEDGLQTVFNGANAVWFNFCANLYEACQTMYVNREPLGAWSYTQYHAFLTAEQKKIPERVWNEVYRYAYLRPHEAGINSGWLKFLAEGQKIHQRLHYERFQEQYMASKYVGSTASADRFYFRCEEVTTWAPSVPPKGELTLKMYNKMYINVTVGNLTYHMFAPKGQTMVVDFSDVTMSNTVVNVYSAGMVQEIGRLAQLYASEATFTGANRLRSIEIGSSAEGYRNAALRALTIGTNRMLEYLYAQNLTSVAGALDLSGCPALIYVDASGSSFAAVTFADGGVLQTAILNNPSTLQMIRLAQLLTFSLTDDTGMQSLRIEDTGIDTKTIVQHSAGLVQARLIGIDWELPDSTLLMRLYNILGLDVHGLATLPHAYLAGDVFVDTISRRELDMFNAAWPALTITYRAMPTEYAVRFYNLDGAAILDGDGEPYVQYITQGETPYNPAADGIENPSMPTTPQYIYTFTGWADITTPVNADRDVYAQYSTQIRTYTVRHLDRRGGTVLQQDDNVPYGAEIVYSGAMPTRTDQEASFIFYAFTGWDKSTGFITGDTDVYAVWSMAANYPAAGTELKDMTPGEVYALTRLLYSKASGSERMAAAAEYLTDQDYIELTMGRDYDFNNVQAQTLVSTPTYFDGATVQEINLTPFASEFGRFTLAIEFEFCEAITGSTLMSIGYKEDGDTTRGLRLRYNSGPDIQWGGYHTRCGHTYQRGIVVIRYKGGRNVFVYTCDLASDSVYDDDITAVELARLEDPQSDAIITLGGLKETDGTSSGCARGWIHWAKIWRDDLGQANAREMANWTHDVMRMEYYGTDQYYLSGTNAQTAAMQLISAGITSHGHRHQATNTNAGGWPASENREFMNGRMLKAFPVWFQALMQRVRVYSSEGNKSTNIVYSDDKVYLPSQRELTGSTAAPYDGEANGRVSWFVAGTDKDGRAYGANASRAKWRGLIRRQDARIYTTENDPTALESATVEEGDLWVNTGGSSYVYMYLSAETVAKHMYLGVNIHQTGTTSVLQAFDGGVWLIAYYWWERSPYPANTTYFLYVNGTGYAGNYYGASHTSALCPSVSL